jgi:hypothetical protein
MLHHDSRGYEEAASAAAAKGRQKMEEIIHRGLTSAEAVIAQIQGAVIEDKVVRAPAVRLLSDDDGWKLGIARGDNGSLDWSGELHPHAFGQLLTDVGVPKKFVESVQSEKMPDFAADDLIAHNVNTILSHRERQRNLIRVDANGGDRVKGFLSDKYRRLDSRPLADAFVGACQDVGLMPIEGVASETKCRIRAVLPKVFEPVANEVMIFGAEFGNSDYGDGGVVLNLWTMRVWCTNLAVVERSMRTVHLGGRLPDDLALSEATYRLDAQTTASAVRDVTAAVVGPQRVNRMLAAIRSASDKELKSGDGIDNILRGLNNKELSQRVRTVYESEDVVNLPAGQTVYRMSNAVSWIAQARDVGPDRRLEMQDFAGKLLVGGMQEKNVREV